MKKNRHSNIEELNDLYELSLSIGTSLEIQDNASSFFSKFSQLKKLTHISIWRKRNFELSLIESYPKLEANAETYTKEAKLIADIDHLKPDTIN